MRERVTYQCHNCGTDYKRQVDAVECDCTIEEAEEEDYF